MLKTGHVRKLMTGRDKLLLIRKRKGRDVKLRLTLEKRISLATRQKQPADQDDKQPPAPSSLETQLTHDGGNPHARVKCPQCSKLILKHYFKKHMENVHPSGPQKQWPCPDCDGQFKARSQLNRHQRIAHLKEEKVMCDKCGNLYPKISIYSHNKIVHGGKEFECPDCGKKFKSAKSLWDHITKTHQGQPQDNHKDKTPADDSYISGDGDGGSDHLCNECGEAFSNNGGMGIHNLRRHYFFKHGEGANSDYFLQCPEEGCGKRFKQKATLDDHIRRAHQGVDFRCDVCGRDLQSAGRLWKHKVEVHGMTDLEPPHDVEVIQCEYCDERVLRGFATHMKKKHPEVDFQRLPMKIREKAVKRGTCPECGKEMRKDDILKHRRNVHWKQKQPPGGPKVPCPDCGNEFWTRSIMNDHRIKVHQKKTFDNLVLSKNLVVQHWNSSKPVFYSCAICNEEETKEMIVMRVHLYKSHSEIYENLQRDGENASIPLNCCLCSWKGEWLEEEDQDLRRHFEQEHPDECFNCPECSKVIISPTELDLHFRRVHYEQNGKVEEVGERKRCAKTVLELDLVCRRCKEEFTSVGEVVAHVENSHPECYWPCHDCQQLEYSQLGLLFHAYYKCHNKKSGKDAKGRNRGKEKGYGNSVVECDICTRRLNLGTLRGHFKRVHGVKEDKWECEECDKRFKKREYWMHHMDYYHACPHDQLLEMAGRMNVKDESQVKPRYNKNSARGPCRRRRCPSSLSEFGSEEDGRSSCESEEERAEVIPKRHCYETRARGRGAEDPETIAKSKRLGVTLKPVQVRLVRLSQTEIDSYLCKMDNFVVEVEAGVPNLY